MKPPNLDDMYGTPTNRMWEEMVEWTIKYMEEADRVFLEGDIRVDTK